MTTVIVDNTVLSNFAHVEQPQLLGEAFDNPVTVRAVMDELTEGVRLERLPSVDWRDVPVIELTSDEQTSADLFGQRLGRGEAECIALAQSRQWMVLTDDRDARAAAREAGVIVSGTLGALMNLVEGGTLSLPQADHLLALMKQHGYRCPIDSLSELNED
jgi:predicted nucleic acid-binding protein